MNGTDGRPRMWHVLYAACFAGIFLAPVATAGRWDALAGILCPAWRPGRLILVLFHWLPAFWMDCLSRRCLLNWALMLLLGLGCRLCQTRMGGEERE